MLREKNIRVGAYTSFAYIILISHLPQQLVYDIIITDYIVTPSTNAKKQKAFHKEGEGTELVEMSKGKQIIDQKMRKLKDD